MPIEDNNRKDRRRFMREFPKLVSLACGAVATVAVAEAREAIKGCKRNCTRYCASPKKKKHKKE
jgi:hypothetical protein